MSHRFKSPNKHGKLDRKAAKWEQKDKYPIEAVRLDIPEFKCDRCKRMVEYRRGVYCIECFHAIQKAVLLVKEVQDLSWGKCRDCGFVPVVEKFQCSLCSLPIMKLAELIRSEGVVSGSLEYSWDSWLSFDRPNVTVDEETFLQPKEGRLILL